MNNMLRRILAVLAAMLAAAALVCAAGCGEDEGASTSDADTVSSSAVTDSAADEAAKDVLQAYFDAFNAQDANAIADIVYCKAVEATGATREDIVTMMQAGIDSNAATYGDAYRFVYDRSEFVCEDASVHVDTINQSFGLSEAEVRIDDAKIVRGTVRLVDSDGVEHEPETGSMLIYRYDGVWYLFGYAG